MASLRSRYGGGRSPVGGVGINPPGSAPPGGTLGGKSAIGRRPGRYQMKLGDEQYLWLLIGLEILATVWLRHAFRRRHGG